MEAPAELDPPRGLSTEDELVIWAAHCKECFAFKASPPPASHFLRHFSQDPYSRRLDFIRVIPVASAAPIKIAATARVCLRRLRCPSAKDGYVWTAGIAEVCVAEAYKGRKLGKVVVEDALRHIESSRPDVCCSFLHCGDWLLKFYASLGYHSKHVTWQLVKMRGDAPTDGSRADGELMSVAVDELRDRVLPVVSHLSTQGVVLRCQAYWDSWVIVEMAAGGPSMQAYVLRAASGEDQEVMAYACVKPYSTQGRQVLALVDYAGDVRHLDRLLSAVSHGEVVRVPGHMAVWMEGTERWMVAGQLEVDQGWMYRSLKDSVDLEWLVEPHVMWPLDHF